MPLGGMEAGRDGEKNDQFGIKNNWFKNTSGTWTIKLFTAVI
jgi:hypothetical protein